MNRLMAWKQSVIFIVGIILATFSWFLIMTIFWPGLILNLAGLTLLVFNIVAMKRLDQIKGAKLALIIPKIIIFLLLLAASVFAYIGHFAVYFFRLILFSAFSLGFFGQDSRLLDIFFVDKRPVRERNFNAFLVKPLLD